MPIDVSGGTDSLPRCTVLDFVANHRREFQFDQKLRALLGGTRREVERQVERDVPFLPSGCHMELDAVARDIVLRSIRQRAQFLALGPPVGRDRLPRRG